MRRQCSVAGDAPRGGAALGSPELAKSGTPGVALSRGKAVEHARGTRDTLVALARHGKARGGARISGGGWAWRNIAGERRSGLGKGSQASNSSA